MAALSTTEALVLGGTLAVYCCITIYDVIRAWYDGRYGEYGEAPVKVGQCRINKRYRSVWQNPYHLTRDIPEHGLAYVKSIKKGWVEYELTTAFPATAGRVIHRVNKERFMEMYPMVDHIRSR